MEASFFIILKISFATRAVLKIGEHIQLLGERLSCKSRKANATMSKVFMDNDGFFTSLIEAQGISALEKEAAQTRVFMHSLTFLLNTLNLNQLALNYYYP